MEVHLTGTSSPSERNRWNCDLVRQFIEHLFAREDLPSESDDSGNPISRIFEWETIQGAAAGADSIEQAIGRSVVIADLLARGKYPHQLKDLPSTPSRTALVRALTAYKGAYSLALATTVVLITLIVAAVSSLGGSSPTPLRTSAHQGIQGNAQLVSSPSPTALTAASLSTTTTTSSLPAATVPPTPAPPSLADAPPLRPHEVFGFAPYWTLSQSAGFAINQISTIAYFSVGVNPDGSLEESGPGWIGYQSQALASLVTRAHSVGDRVVLTVNDFGQDSLNQLTSSPSAPAALAKALIGAIQAKNLDGVNLDFEGQGSSDQVGLTSLVTYLSAAIHGVDPNYQVTMDTYASAAGDSNGFYNIHALAPALDGFFVMAYQLNLQATASSVSPLTSTMFSEKTAIDQYVAEVPPAKVILGMPFFGIDWPTSDGTLTANATGPATTVSYGQVVASGHPIYWDSTTDTAWTSYQVGSQWHETFFEVPSSLYDAAQLASSNGLGGMGIWALGMDGNDPNMTSALLGFSPAIKTYSAGPVTTSSSSTTTTSTQPASTTSPSTTSTTDPASGTSTSTSSTDPNTTTSSSTTSPTDPASATSTSTSSTDPNTTTSTSTSPIILLPDP